MALPYIVRRIKHRTTPWRMAQAQNCAAPVLSLHCIHASSDSHPPRPLDPRHRLGAPAQGLGRGYEVLRDFKVRSSFSVEFVHPFSSGGTDDRSPPLLQYTLTFSSLPYLTLPNYYLHHPLQYPTTSRTSLLFLFILYIHENLSPSVNTRSVQLARRLTLFRRYNASNGLPRLTLSASVRDTSHT